MKRCFYVFIMGLFITLTACNGDNADMSMGNITEQEVSIDETLLQDDVAPVEKTAIESMVRDSCEDIDNKLTLLSENVEKAQSDTLKQKVAYAFAIQRVRMGRMPEDGYQGFGGDFFDEEESPNKYAVVDVDRDGNEELLIQITGTNTASMMELVYDYDPETKGLHRELGTFPANTYYSNGSITSGWSHNQGLGPNFWPYDVYTYDSEKDEYVFQGSVDTWEKSYKTVSCDNTPFPDEIDMDGDGVIYYIGNAEGLDYEKAVDNKDYEQWSNNYTVNADELTLEWKSVDDTTYDIYAEEYKKSIYEEIQSQQQEGKTDLGLLYIEGLLQINESGGEPIDKICNYLQERFEQPVEPQEVESCSVMVDGEEVFFVLWEDGTSISYQYKQIEDITLCGIQPGMDKVQAEQLMNNYGLFLGNSNEDSSHYISGIYYNNYGIFINYVDDKVESISIGLYSEFAG